MLHRKPSEIYQKPVEVAFRDCDNLNRIKLSTLMSYVADIGGEDYTIKGYSHDYLWDHGFVFLLSRMTVRIHRYFQSYQPITVETFERGVKGPLFYRDFEMLDEQGEVAVSAHSAWILVQPESRKILRPSDFPKATPDNFDMVIDCPEPEKIKVPKEMELVRTKTIRYTDLDCNGHTYNAVYADIAYDSIPFENTQKPLRDFSINFVNEAKLGEELKIYRADEKGKTLVQGRGEKGVCFTCSFKFANV